MKNKIKVTKIVKIKTTFALLCGGCKKPLKDFEHYSRWDGKDADTVVVWPCDCKRKES